MSKSRSNFVRLAEGRTNKILKAIDLLSNLSNRTNYSYNEADIKKIFAAIEGKMRDARARFELRLKAKNDDKFKL